MGNARLMGWQKSINMTNSQFSNISSLFCKCGSESWKSSPVSECHGLISHSCWVPPLHISCKYSRALHPTSTNDWQCDCSIWSSSTLSFCRKELQHCLGHSNPHWLLPMFGTGFWDLYSILVPTK